MNIQIQPRQSLVIGSVVAVVILATIAVSSSAALRGTGAVETRQAPTVAAETVTLDAGYAGYVALSRALPGVYSDTLATAAAPLTDTLPDLGSVDLEFLLHRSEDNLIGYVDLDTTLVFTAEHTITATLVATTTRLTVGPYVSGAVEGNTVRLESERITQITGAGQRLMRQFRLIGTLADLDTFTGEYRETVWGYGPQPLTVIGSFTLTRLSGLSVNLSNRIYLPLIRR